MITAKQQNELLTVLKKRFDENKIRHQKISWEQVYDKLISNPEKLTSLYQMEETGGEPDVIVIDNDTKRIIFADCASESPKGRRSVCYDHDALESRKQYKPENSALNMAEEMGVEMMDESQYFALQQLGEFDLKTSSWIKTSSEVRSRGGALFGDRRFGRVFIYHNGAESYYAARGFRAILYI